MKRTIMAAMVLSLAVGSLALADPPDGHDRGHGHGAQPDDGVVEVPAVGQFHIRHRDSDPTVFVHGALAKVLPHRHV